VLKSTRPKFKKFRARYAKVLEKLLFSNKGVKIKEKEKKREVISPMIYTKIFGAYKMS
jgi:hypothetical protein